ncbi:MAG TPA: Type 1 glutamine amidotransferase-like domain-containing protein [Actinomycetota bacterium]|nr:Type 1 glutamine amidotransferase-like domain-containing protein [Actinomycetota bacterium]
MARTFLLLGSGEFEPWTHDVEASVLRDAVGDGSVAILPTASATEGDDVFDRWGRMGLDHFAEARVSAEVLPVKTPADARREDLVTRAASASLIYFSGGKPTHLAEVLHASPLLAGIERAMDRGAVWAGCSAGAMVVSRARVGGTAGSSWRFGLGLVPDVAFGVHWDKVRRIPGAAWWMSSRLPEGAWFVGIDERTAIVGDGERWTVHGLGAVHVRHGAGRATHAPGSSFETLAQANR